MLASGCIVKCLISLSCSSLESLSNALHFPIYSPNCPLKHAQKPLYTKTLAFVQEELDILDSFSLIDYVVDIHDSREG